MQGDVSSQERTWRGWQTKFKEEEFPPTRAGGSGLYGTWRPPSREDKNSSLKIGYYKHRFKILKRRV